jgi:hemoglobin-like flavoprotein
MDGLSAGTKLCYDSAHNDLGFRVTAYPPCDASPLLWLCSNVSCNITLLVIDYLFGFRQRWLTRNLARLDERRLVCLSGAIGVADYVDGNTEVEIVERKVLPAAASDDNATNGDSHEVYDSMTHRLSIVEEDTKDLTEVEESTGFEEEAQDALSRLQKTYGTAELEKSDVAFLMDGWNKILGWETMWKEACWFRWRILAAREELLRKPAKDGSPAMSRAEAARRARHLVEENKDPIARVFGTRAHDGKNLIFALFDEQVRSLCPHKQTVQREAYRPVSDDRGAAFGLTLECNTSKEIFRLFSTLGVHPNHYLTLCEAFLFAMESHSPYAKEDDEEDLEMARDKSAYARFVAQHVAKPGIKDTMAVRETFATPLYVISLPGFWNWVKSENDSFGESFYTNLLDSFPILLDYFARADMDTLAGHIVLAFDLMVKYPTMAGESSSSFRKTCDHLGEMHRELGIPTDAYPMIGMNLIETLKPFSELYADKSKGTKHPVTQEELEQAFVVVYAPTMSFTFYPMLREERIVLKATKFFETVADELDWSPSQLSKRMLEVKLEVAASGTYQHTSEELQLGARLAWRNSTKVCISVI